MKGEGFWFVEVSSPFFSLFWYTYCRLTIRPRMICRERYSTDSFSVLRPMVRSLQETTSNVGTSRKCVVRISNPSWSSRLHAFHGCRLQDGHSRISDNQVVSTDYAVLNFRLMNIVVIHFSFRGGLEIPYDGDRTKEAMVDFAWKSLG